MELTQERLNELVNIREKAQQAAYEIAIRAQALRTADRASIIAIIEAATGEKVTIVEPEPEIPEAAIEAVAELLWLRVYRGPFADAAAGVRRTYLSCARKHLIAAYKAGWGGLRK